MAGRRSAGLLFVAIMQTFQVDRSEGSWPLMLMGAVIYLAGLITGPLAHRFNARPVIIAGAAIASAGSILCFFASTIKLMALTLGVIHAVGAGMVFIIAPTIISEHFLKNKGLAMGLNFTGVTLGLFVFPKLLEFLNASYGLHGALLIFGAVCLNGLAFSLFLRTPSWRKISPSNNQLDPEIPAQWNDQPRSPKLRHAMTVFKEPVIYLIMYSFNTYCLGYECYVSLFVDFACDKGIMVSTAVTVMAAGAVFEVLGRLTLPALIDRGLLQIKTAVLLTLVLGAVTFLILPFVNSHELIFTLAFVIAFTIGTGMVIFSMTLASYFGHEKMPVSFGIVVASAGMFSFVKPYLIGHFRDKIGAYDWLFVICGLLNAIGAATWIVVFEFQRSKRKNNVTQTENLPGEITVTTKCSLSIATEPPR